MTDRKTDELKGRAKEAAGAVTDDKELKNEGKTDQAAASMKEENKEIVQVEGEAGILGLIAQGYKPCGRCAKAYGRG